jgi:hypothetical protein
MTANDEPTGTEPGSGGDNKVWILPVLSLLAILGFLVYVLSGR